MPPAISGVEYRKTLQRIQDKEKKETDENEKKYRKRNYET